MSGQRLGVGGIQSFPVDPTLSLSSLAPLTPQLNSLFFLTISNQTLLCFLTYYQNLVTDFLPLLKEHILWEQTQCDLFFILNMLCRNQE